MKITTKWFAREPLSAEKFEAGSLAELKMAIIEYYSSNQDEEFMSLVEIWSETKLELGDDDIKDASIDLKRRIAKDRGENE